MCSSDLGPNERRSAELPTAEKAIPAGIGNVDGFPWSLLQSKQKQSRAVDQYGRQEHRRDGKELRVAFVARTPAYEWSGLVSGSTSTHYLQRRVSSSSAEESEQQYESTRSRQPRSTVSCAALKQLVPRRPGFPAILQKMHWEPQRTAAAAVKVQDAVVSAGRAGGRR